MKPLEFNQERCLKHLEDFGYTHLAKETPRSLLEPFMEEHGLALEEGSQFTVTLVPSGKQESGTDWEQIRQERHAKRVKAAERAKKKELTQ